MAIQDGLMSSRMEADAGGEDPKVGAPKCPIERLNRSHALTTSAPARSPAGGAAAGYRACARGHQRTAVFIPSASLAPLGEGDTS